MTNATARRPRTTAATTSNAVKAERGRRVSLGTLFSTSNEDFFSGPIAAQNGQYLNQTEFLGLLGEAPAGQAWRIKAFVKEAKGKTVIDVIAELEPTQR
jgi:hypothetical protein